MYPVTYFHHLKLVLTLSSGNVFLVVQDGFDDPRLLGVFGIFQKGTLKLVFLRRIGANVPVLDIRSQEGTVVEVLFGQDRSIVFHESCGESREKWTRHDG